MESRFSLRILVKTALVAGLLSSCAHRSHNDAEANGSSPKGQGNRVGFYALDGSSNICPPPESKDITLICQLHFASTTPVKAYFAGVMDFRFASDLGAINDKAVSRICADLEAGKVEKVLLVGYSRGAISALIVADRIKSECGPQGASAAIWLGLLDAVESSAWTFGRQLRDIGSMRSIPNGAKALHIHKDPIRTAGKLIDLFETTQLRVAPGSGATLDVKTVQGIGHGEIGRGIVGGEKRVGESFPAYVWLKTAAQAEGATFTEMKTLDGIGK